MFWFGISGFPHISLLTFVKNGGMHYFSLENKRRKSHWMIEKSVNVILDSLLLKFLFDFCTLQLYIRQWHPTPAILPGKSHGWRSLVGCSPWGCWESDTTERLHFHSSLSCFGEGNGNPLQCSCLENPRDGGAWRAAVHGVAQSQTRLKWLSSSSSSNFIS